jgi:hypothetical protein
MMPARWRCGSLLFDLDQHRRLQRINLVLFPLRRLDADIDEMNSAAIKPISNQGA